MKLTYLPKLNLAQTAQIMTAFLSAGAFILSLDNLMTFSEAHGIPTALCWLWAITIDLAILIFGLARISDRLKGEGATLNTAFFWTATACSIGANVADSVTASDWLSVFTHAVPPLFLCGCLESLLQRLERDFNAPDKAKGNSPIGKTITEEQQAQILRLKQDGLTQKAIAQRVGVSVPTVASYIKKAGEVKS